MSAMQIKQIKEFKGTIKLVTGLHIGSGNEAVHIGGIDNEVVKDSDGNPYIPGSSLKGKIRSLLELSEGTTEDGSPSSGDKYPDSFIPVVFGDLSGKRGITRILFRDAFLSEESKKRLKEKSILPTEVKSENSIDRLTGKACNPRQTERAIPGLTFDFSIALRLLDGDDEQQFCDLIAKGFKLLEADALGGSGSRGYGKVSFLEVAYDDKPFYGFTV